MYAHTYSPMYVCTHIYTQNSMYVHTSIRDATEYIGDEDTRCHCLLCYARESQSFTDE